MGFSSSKTGSSRSRFCSVRMAKQMLHDEIDVQGEQNPLAQRVLMEQRRNVQLVGLKKLLHQANQLEHQIIPVPVNPALQVVERLARRQKDQPLLAGILGQLLQVDRHGPCSGPLHHPAPARCSAAIGVCGRVEGQRLDRCPSRPTSVGRRPYRPAARSASGSPGRCARATTRSACSASAAVAARRPPASWKIDSGTPKTLTYSGRNKPILVQCRRRRAAARGRSPARTATGW